MCDISDFDNDGGLSQEEMLFGMMLFTGGFDDPNPKEDIWGLGLNDADGLDDDLPDDDFDDE